MTNTQAPRYTVLTYDGIGPYGGFPEAPADHNGAHTLADAVKLFRAWMCETGNDYTRAEGYGQPWADVVLTSSWDGVSYGDITGGDGVMRLERGPRGGVNRLSF